jgi:adenylosuccinate synthase
MITAYVVAGLAYGDEGKGATVDFLTRETKAGLVVRYNGGPQAGHNVVLEDGRHHTFSQFGSGTFVPGVRTHLSRFMLIDPVAQMRENDNLKSLGVDDAFKRTTIEDRSLVITPYQRAVNKLESTIRTGNNTCGMGIGQARKDNLEYGDKVLFAGDLKDEKVTREKLRFLHAVCRRRFEKLAQVLEGLTHESLTCPAWLDSGQAPIDDCWEDYERWPGKVVSHKFLTTYLMGSLYRPVIFEGAQGVLLDETFGDEGFNTWTDTTFWNAQCLLKAAQRYIKVVKLGVIRNYLTRHGDGPFPSEVQGWEAYLPEPHNDDHGFQGKFRRGLLDLNALSYAVGVCGGIDGLVINHLDRIPFQSDRMATIEEAVGAKIWIRGVGPTAKDKGVSAEFVNTAVSA